MIRLAASAWLGVLVVAPLLVVLVIAFAVPDQGLPPFRLPIEGGRWVGGSEAWGILTEDFFYLSALLRSLAVAAVTAGLCIALSYPMALGILWMAPARRQMMLALVVLPLCVGFVLRMAAWVGVLRDSGLLNQALLAMGLISAPVEFLYSMTGLLLGMVHSYLPFALLPLYAALAARDLRLEEAAADLGAGPFTVFRTITLPGSAAAAAAGFLLVFIPAAGEFVIPALLGAPDALLAGGAIWQEFFTSRDWPLAAAASIALLAVLLPPLLLWQRLAQRR
jgi:putrescine transport system permease protein